MNVPVLLAGVGSMLLGVAWVAAPRRVYHFGFESLGGVVGSGPSEPSDAMLWAHRVFGVGQLVIGSSWVALAL